MAAGVATAAGCVDGRPSLWQGRLPSAVWSLVVRSHQTEADETPIGDRPSRLAREASDKGVRRPREGGAEPPSPMLLRQVYHPINQSES